MNFPALAVVVFFAASAAAQQQCGQTPVPPNLGSKEGNEEIVGGTNAQPYSWPWQVVWCKSGWFGCSLECGGSVIDNGWVVTAGHCVYGSTNSPSSFRVKVGVYSEDSSSESGEQVLEVQAIHLHPKYQANPDPQWDIALIELKTQVAYTNHIQPVCLPSKDSTVVVEPNSAWVTGWGTTTEDGSISKTLRQVKVPFVNPPTCEIDYPHTINEEVMICAGQKNLDTCQGDSGGPLVVQNPNGTWYMYGLTSFGQGCAEYKHPGIYSRVTAYCDWIAQTTSNKVQCQDPMNF
uniref:limulus clotting factor C n=2 Tax=Plectus sambesii TaxID=2011161 RepID=A0A914V6H3_9BILA